MNKRDIEVLEEIKNKLENETLAFFKIKNIISDLENMIEFYKQESKEKEEIKDFYFTGKKIKIGDKIKIPYIDPIFYSAVGNLHDVETYNDDVAEVIEKDGELCVSVKDRGFYRLSCFPLLLQSEGRK